MSIESLNSDLISQTALKIRHSTPDYDWGGGELTNAVIESFVVEWGLPWVSDIGYPDWDDPRVQALGKRVNELMAEENSKEKLEGITAKCVTKNCTWTAVGSLKVERVTRTIEASQLTGLCKDHHFNMGFMVQHNRFRLFHNDTEVGIASVSSQACTGYIQKI